MSTAQQLYDEAMALPADERKRLAVSLLRSLPSALDEWEAELQRRIDEIDRGEVAAIPWDEALDLIFSSANR